MSKIGIIIEIKENEIKETNYGVITAAKRQDSHEIYALLIGAGPDLNMEKLKKYGVGKAIDIKFEDGRFSLKPDLQAKAVAAAAKHYHLDAVLGLGSSRGKDLLARVAAFMNRPLMQDCMDVNICKKTVKKSYFAGKIMATLKLQGDLLLCGMRPNAIDAVEAGCEMEKEVFTTNETDDGNMIVKEINRSGINAMDLTEASIIVTGGRPIDSKDNFKMLEACAAKLNAAVGASRAAVDAGFAPHSMQVGQTGKTVSPKLYIGCGLSGSVQHFAGMKTSQIIVDVNKDKDATIFRKCDYGIIEEMFEVVPALTKAL